MKRRLPVARTSFTFGVGVDETETYAHRLFTELADRLQGRDGDVR